MRDVPAYFEQVADEEKTEDEEESRSKKKSKATLRTCLVAKKGDERASSIRIKEVRTEVTDLMTDLETQVKQRHRKEPPVSTR